MAESGTINIKKILRDVIVTVRVQLVGKDDPNGNHTYRDDNYKYVNTAVSEENLYAMLEEFGKFYDTKKADPEGYYINQKYALLNQ